MIVAQTGTDVTPAPRLPAQVHIDLIDDAGHVIASLILDEPASGEIPRELWLFDPRSDEYIGEVWL